MKISDLLRSASMALAERNWQKFDENHDVDDFTFIHFTKGIKVSDQRTEIKLGVRPPVSQDKGNITHLDPTGVFAYPLLFALQHPQYYGTDYPYWVVFKVQPGGNGIVLQKAKEDMLYTIAARNGWGAIYEQIKNLDNKHIEQVEYKSAGGAWYRLAKSLVLGDGKKYAKQMIEMVENGYGTFVGGEGLDEFVNECKKPWTWFKLLAGVDWIYDTGGGYIHPNEPQQICVINNATIQVLDSGINKEIKNKNPNELELLLYKVNTLLKLSFKDAELGSVSSRETVQEDAQNGDVFICLTYGLYNLVNLYINLLDNKFEFRDIRMIDSTREINGQYLDRFYLFTIKPFKHLLSILPLTVQEYLKQPSVFKQHTLEIYNNITKCIMHESEFNNILKHAEERAAAADPNLRLRFINFNKYKTFIEEQQDGKILIQNPEKTLKIETARGTNTGTVYIKDLTTDKEHKLNF